MLDYLDSFSFELLGKLSDSLDLSEIDMEGLTVFEMTIAEVIDQLQTETLLSFHRLVIAEEEEKTIV
jgi:hypothetical protein